MENDRFKSLHRGYFEIDEASLRSWNFVKSLLGDSSNRSVPPIKADDDIVHHNTKENLKYSTTSFVTNQGL
jgi:hypothetical protein